MFLRVFTKGVAFTLLFFLSFNPTISLAVHRNCSQERSTCQGVCQLEHPFDSSGLADCLAGCESGLGNCCLANWGGCWAGCELFPYPYTTAECQARCNSELEACQGASALPTSDPLGIFPSEDPIVIIPTPRPTPSGPIWTPVPNQKPSIFETVADRLCQCVNADSFYGESTPLPSGGFLWHNQSCNIDITAGLNCGNGSIGICCGIGIPF